MGTFDNDAASNYQRNQKLGNAGTSALKGAGYGAAAGAMIGGPAAPITAAIGAGIGGGVGLIGGALKSVDQLEKERRAFLEQETAAAKAGELGYSESEKQHCNAPLVTRARTLACGRWVALRTHPSGRRSPGTAT